MLLFFGQVKTKVNYKKEIPGWVMIRDLVQEGGLAIIGAIVGAIVLFVLGIILSGGKGAFLIAGFNMMSKEEKEKYDKVALCKFMGKMMFALSFSMVFWVLGEVFESKRLFAFGLVLFFGIVIFTLIYANTGNRFKR